MIPIPPYTEDNLPKILDCPKCKHPFSLLKYENGLRWSCTRHYPAVQIQTNYLGFDEIHKVGAGHDDHPF